jgi:predicted membrane channel-forming protein YqfA (hemolysin III family)
MGLRKIETANHYLYDGATLHPTPFLASDIDNPLLPALFIVPLMLGVLGILFLAIKRPAASTAAPRRRHALLLVGVACIIVGGFLTLMFATTRGGAPPFLYLVAVIPLLIGLRIIARWGRSDRL